MPLPASAFPLRVSGAKILGADGQPVLLAGVNWGGGQQDEGCPYGLDVLHRDEIAGRIAAMGLNHVRLLFSVGSLLTNKGNPVTVPVPAYRLAANPDLKGMSPWQVLQAVTDACTKAGLYVILNQHLLHPGWCCSGSDGNGFWYNDNWPASTFIKCWEMIATRFAGNKLAGYDIHNEPRQARIGGAVRNPSWGDGNGNTDFRSMYEVMTSLIRKGDPDCLVFCEGLSYAGDLTGWKAAPVRKPNAVPSLHDYPFFHKGTTTYGDYAAAMDKRAGYLLTEGIAPLWIGEFGTNTDVPLKQMQSFWLAWLVQWAAARGAHWCWWELGSTAVTGTEPGTNAVKMQFGQREAFSLMAGQDWKGTQTALLDMLGPILPAG